MTMNALQLTFPSSTPLLSLTPAVGEKRMEVHARSLPAKTFTGDFYFTHWKEDQLWFAIGDVSGKGLRAALIMAMIQEQLEEQLQRCASSRSDPSLALTRLHTFLRPLLGGNRFATAVAGTLSGDGELRIANAGHCAPLILRRHGAIEEINSTGPVAGLLETSRWCTTRRQLRPGDLLAIYTDGISEAEAPNGTEFGSSRLIDTLRSHQTSDLQRLATATLDAVARHSVGARMDDQTLLVLRMGA